jgi:hypothetical protein
MPESRRLQASVYRGIDPSQASKRREASGRFPKDKAEETALGGGGEFYTWKLTEQSITGPGGWMSALHQQGSERMAN